VELAAAFGLALRSARPEPRGSVDTLYRLETNVGGAYLRIAEGKEEDEVRFEAALVSHLAARGVAVARPVVARDGRPLLRWNDRLVTMAYEALGRHLEHRDLRPDHLDQVGTAVASLHLAVAGFGPRRPSRYAFERIVERLAGIPAVLATRSTDPEATHAVARLSEETTWLREHRAASLPTGVIHGDLFPDNVLFDGERLSVLLDFEQAAEGALVYDLAVTLCAFCFGDVAFEPSLCKGLVAGYEKARPLTLAERDGFYAEARAAAHRFTVTRLTDFHLKAAPGGRVEKDYRRYLTRLERLAAMGPEGFTRLVFGRAAAAWEPVLP
jgi:homoserine kinase type II